MASLPGPAGVLSCILAIFIISVSCSTAKKIPPQQPDSTKPGDSMVLDRDGNKYPIKKFADNKLWIITNLALNIPGSFCYENLEDKCERYGRLYTWEAGREGCPLLGEGWRLPGNDEWMKLSVLQVGIVGDSNVIRKAAFKDLLLTGSSGFNALLGGGRDQFGKFERMEAHGFYWTATERDSGTAFFSNFAKGSQALYQQKDGEKERAFSVRCVKSINTLE